MEKLKNKCLYHNNTTNLVKELIKTILQYEEQFDISKLVNTTYSKFVDSCDYEQVKNVMEDMKMLYFCLGPDFLLNIIKPIS